MENEKFTNRKASPEELANMISGSAAHKVGRGLGGRLDPFNIPYKTMLHTKSGTISGQYKELAIERIKSGVEKANKKLEAAGKQPAKVRVFDNLINQEGINSYDDFKSAIEAAGIGENDLVIHFFDSTESHNTG